MAQDITYYVNKHGKIIRSSENDGPAFLRKGAQAVDKEVRFDQLDSFWKPKIKEDLDRFELTEAFEKWFTGLLLREGSSCLERDVLRNQRKNLLAEWISVRPIYTTSDAESLNAKAADTQSLGAASGRPDETTG